MQGVSMQYQSGIKVVYTLPTALIMLQLVAVSIVYSQPSGISYRIENKQCYISQWAYCPSVKGLSILLQSCEYRDRAVYRSWVLHLFCCKATNSGALCPHQYQDLSCMAHICLLFDREEAEAWMSPHSSCICPIWL